MVGGALLSMAALLAAIPLLDAPWLVVAAYALAMGAAAGAAPAITLLAAAGPDRNRTVARLHRFQGYGWAGGLLLGAAWIGAATALLPSLAAERLLFLACAAIGGAAGVALFRWLPGDGTPRLSRLRHLPRQPFHAFLPGVTFWAGSMRFRRLSDRFNRSLALYFLALAVFFAGFHAFFAPLPLFLVDAGAAPGAVFALYTLSSLTAATLSGAAGRLADRSDLRRLQAAALGLRGATIPVIGLVGAGAGAVAWLAATGGLFVVIGTTWAVIAVTAVGIVSGLAPDGVRGEALGAYTGISTVAGGIGGILGGVLAREAFILSFAAAGGLVLLGAGIVLALPTDTI